MKIEKLTNDKIRIFLNLKDLQEQNIDLHSFMSNSIESQKIFTKILNKSEKEYGFITRNYEIFLEALMTPECNFVLTITRFSKSINKTYSKKKNNAYKKNLSFNNISSLIYAFSSFDDFCDFCININNINIHNFAKKAYLYCFNNIYYLVFNDLILNSSEANKVYLCITEFAEFKHDSELFERKLLEYGNLIIKNNAVSICNNFFIK